MPLPNADRAWVPQGKITEYLLSDDHPDGRHKARFLRALGFSRRDPSALAAGLLLVASSGILAHRIDSAFGFLYLVDGVLHGPAGSAAVRTAWIIPTEDDRPQLVTTFPRRKEESP